MLRMIKKTSKTAALSCMDLSFDNAGKDDRGFTGVSFRLEYGQCGIFVSDSRTRVRRLMQICSTMEEPRHGLVKWFGLDPWANESTVFGVRRSICWMNRSVRLVSNMSLIDNIVISRVYHGNINKFKAYEEVEGLLYYFNLNHIKDKRPADVSHRDVRMSCYVRELAKLPRLFLFEYPTDDIDKEFLVVYGYIQDVVRKKEAAVIIAENPGSDIIKNSDWVFLLKQRDSSLIDIKDFSPDQIVFDGTSTYSDLSYTR